MEDARRFGVLTPPNVTSSRDHGSRAADAGRLVVRGAWLALGLLCVAIGSIGLVVPGLPTTVFFIGAAACFTRSSPRLEAWVLGLPGIGRAVGDYRSGLGMPHRAKMLALTMLTLGVGLSTWRLNSWTVRAVVVALGVVGVIWILRTPTKRS